MGKLELGRPHQAAGHSTDACQVEAGDGLVNLWKTLQVPCKEGYISPLSVRPPWSNWPRPVHARQQAGRYRPLFSLDACQAPDYESKCSLLSDSGLMRQIPSIGLRVLVILTAHCLPAVLSSNMRLPRYCDGRGLVALERGRLATGGKGATTADVEIITVHARCCVGMWPLPRQAEFLR